jgi:hypothetical protein
MDQPYMAVRAPRAVIAVTYLRDGQHGPADNLAAIVQHLTD